VILNEDFHHKVHFEHYRTSIDLVRELGILAIKTLITLNSGAFIVLLTFIGNAAAQSQFSVPLGTLKISMICFLGGLGFAGMSIAVTYVSVQSATPYPEGAKDTSDYWHLVTMMGPPLASFIVFLTGVALLICDVSQL